MNTFLVKSENNTERIEYLDLFRGFGIILMLMGHIGFGDIFDHYIHAFHMPMFFFISGYFYKRIPFKEFIYKKCRSLLIPYLVFGLCHDALYLIFFGKEAAWDGLIHILWVNTEGFPIAGALWFVTALFFAELLYFIIDIIPCSEIIKSFFIALIALFGNFSSFVLPFRLPWALDAAFVGLGLFHIAHKTRISRNSVVKKVFNIPMSIILPVGGV